MTGVAEWSLAARLVFPVEGEPIRDARLTIRGGTIAGLEPARRRAADLDLGNVAVVPGFVNAHTHLELGPLPVEPAGGPEDQISWLHRVIAQRRGQSLQQLRATVARNLAASLAVGTTLVADNTTAGLSWDVLSRSPIGGVVYSELIGLRRERALESSRLAFEWLARASATGARGALKPGLAPHAPYSTAGWLYQGAAATHVPLSTHLAELPEEIELLALREGRLRAFLGELGAWDDDWEPVGERPADFVRRGDLRRADWIVAHGTYLDPDDFWQFRPEAAPSGQRVAVAYCPRTTARFGHGPHPYRALLERGVVVCLGTDSLASSPTLSVLDEMRALRRGDSTLSGSLLLTMATLFGAWALRADERAGSLKPAKSADLTIIALPARDEDDPYRLILDGSGPVVGTMIGGRFVYGLWKGP
jgi:cytosine/adenosine deaminase-related metal-dependent hydrolase